MAVVKALLEGLVDDAAACPTYPRSLYDALVGLGDTLELGAGTGIASAELATRDRSVVVTDLGPRMLAPAAGRCSGGTRCRSPRFPTSTPLWPSAGLTCSRRSWTVGLSSRS